MMRWVRIELDRVAAWCCVLVGLVCLIAGYIGISGKALAAEQLPYLLSGGLGGIFALGLGSALLLSADLRDEWRKLDSIDEALRGNREETLRQLHSAAPITQAASLDEPPVVPSQTSTSPKPRTRSRAT